MNKNIRPVTDKDNEIMEIVKTKKIFKGDNYCVDCKKNCRDDKKDYYMVKNYLWIKYGVDHAELCIDCLENRIGRKLNANDILVCEVTMNKNYYTREILLNA